MKISIFFQNTDHQEIMEIIRKIRNKLTSFLLHIVQPKFNFQRIAKFLDLLL